MPTYRACGVTARLATCDLKPTLSNFVDLRMGTEQRKDAARIQKALSTGEKLGERVIGADGSEKGVVQFIGAHEDMPLYVVEASEKLRKSHLPIATVVQQEFAQSTETPSSSPLTSLGATPTPTQEVFAESTQSQHPFQAKPQKKSKQHAKPKPQAKSQPLTSVESRELESHTLEDALQEVVSVYNASEQALVLDIEMENESFLPTKGGSGSLGKDLKIEIFISGELAGIHFINARRSASQIIGDKIRFAGTRVHRQTEKPWVYKMGEESSEDGQAEKRWSTTSNSLIDQARQRGTDRYGDLQPTAEFLGALATIQLPERLRSIASVGIIDVVITAGRGQKHGPDTAYLTRPTPMDDDDFSINNPAVDPVLLPPTEPMSLFEGGAVVSPLRAMDLSKNLPMESSPDVPLRSRARMPSSSASPSPTKKTVNLAREFGFDLTRSEGKLLTLGAFENARGKAGPEGRSLLQRLGDLKKMNETNQARELAKLKEELGEFVRASAVEPQPEHERPAKRARTNSDANYMDPSKLVLNPHTMHVNQSMAQDDVFGVVHPEAVLTQDRIDLALDSGAASNGALLHRIASTSPVKSSRKTKAAALAYSPTHTAIKGQRRTKSSTTLQKPPLFSLSFSSDSAAPFALPPQTPPRAADTSPTKSGGRGANRTASKWEPQEKSFMETLESFKSPETFKGSCVGYPASKEANRQIGKARGGTFREEAIVVGMRFCVW